MNSAVRQRILVLVNRRSGVLSGFETIQAAVERFWDVENAEVFFQSSKDAADGLRKARRAVESGTGVLLVAGGDGTVNTIGQALVGTETVLGVIPVGSGNGFARHFGIPLTPGKAVEALARGRVKEIDVGVVNGRPFFVTCSMAWDAAIVRSFEQAPFRGILPYLLAGVQQWFEYVPQDMELSIDGGEPRRLVRPMILTVANLTQYGGGAKIAPQARADDGFLELVVALREDAPRLMANIGRVFAGSIDRIPEVKSFRFRSLRVKRERGVQIQVDGELVDAGPEVEVGLSPRRLRVLVPG